MGSVAFYIGSLKKGGAERVFVNLATYFLEQGCNVTMVTQYEKENEYELHAGIRRVISDLTPEEEGGRIANLFRRYRKPVSYTHLDVYKRQGKASACKLEKEKGTRSV